MADESERKTSMRRITNPEDDTQYVDVKVIDQIQFTDPKSRAQEYVFRFNNFASSARKVRTATVHGSDNPDDTVKVERVEEFTVLDPKQAGQEFTYRLSGNATDPPQHQKTHKVKIHNPDNRDLWIEVQRIDELAVSDPKDNAQERVFTLSWNDDDETNPSTVDTSEDGTTINPPWRLDPFQNIVDVHWSPADAHFITIFFNLFTQGSTMALWEMINLPFAPRVRQDLLQHGGFVYHDVPPGDPVPEVVEFDPDVLFPAEMLAHLYMWTDGPVEVREEAGGIRGFGQVIVNTKKIIADFPADHDWVQFAIAIPKSINHGGTQREYWTVTQRSFTDGFGQFFPPRDVVFTNDPDVPYRIWTDLVGFPDLVIGTYPILINGSGGDASAFYNANIGNPELLPISYQSFSVDNIDSVQSIFTIRSWEQDQDVYSELVPQRSRVDAARPVANTGFPVSDLPFRIEGTTILDPRQQTTVG